MTDHDESITDDRTRGETSQAGYANSEIRRNPEQPTGDVEDGTGEGAQHTDVTPSVGDTSEDLIDRIDGDTTARDQSGDPVEPR